MSRLGTPSIHLVTSRARLAPEARTTPAALAALEQQLDDAIDAGIDVVHIRERDLDGGLLLAFVSRIVSRAAASRTSVLVSERADVALAAGAAGVHLPASGLAAGRVRTLGPDWLIGRSIHSGDLPADRGACDYLLFGTVFPSASKAPGSPVAGLAGLAEAVSRTGRPVVAIGGVNAARVRTCLDAGAAGIAAIGLFLPAGRTPEALGVRAAAVALRAVCSQ